MTTTTGTAANASEPHVLAALRALAVNPPESLGSMLPVADYQAQLLRDLLPIPAGQIPTHLTDLIPSIRVEYIDDIPVAGISFWGNGHWHIHVRASDSLDDRTFTVLHQLKHIIDHPLRRRTTMFSDSEWEVMANHFATRVILNRSTPVASPPGWP